MKKIWIINGPNLNLLGKREKDIYGSISFDDYLNLLQQDYEDIDIHYFHSNSEGALIDKLHEVGFEEIGIIINMGGYSHTSIALMDALAAITASVVEVHISNIYAREVFRNHSVTAQKCLGVISGLGLEGYALAIEYLRKL